MKKHLLSFKIFCVAIVAFALLGFNTTKAATFTVNITAPTNTTIVAGTNFTISATLGGGANRITFYTYNGTTYTTINTDNSGPTYTSNTQNITTPGTYTYAARSSTGGATFSTYATITITIIPAAPTVTITTLPGGCGGGSTTFKATGGTPNGGTYNWYLNSAGSTTGGNPEATTTGTGGGTNPSNYTVSLYSATTYYVSYTVDGEESGLTAITANIKDYPFTTQTTGYGLTYQYTFTGNANDVSGNGNTGTAQPGATLTTDRFGVTSSAYSLNGSTGFISTAASITAPTVFTINMWFNTTTAGGALAGFNSSQTGAGGTYDRSLYLNSSGQIIFGTYNAGFQTIQSTTAYNDGNWHMVTASIASDGMKLYVDGTLVASNIAYTTPQPNTGWWRFGEQNLSGWPGSVSNYFTGQIDDIDIYGRELTANEVYSLQGAEVSPVCVGGTLSFSANTNTGSSYSWTGPNGFTSTSQNPTISNVTAANTGNYTVVVTGTDGCTSQQTIYGAAEPLPDASFTVPTNAVVNTTTTLTLGTAVNSSLYTYSYIIGDGSEVAMTGNSFQINWPTVGAKTVTLTVTNIATGCTSTYSAALNVSLNVLSGNYAFSQPATLNTTTSGITTTLTTFPALVYIKEDALKAGTGFVQNCANNIQFPTGGNSTGYDFAFTLNGSNTELFYQVQNYDPTTGTLTAWVQIPSVSASSNVALTFYFGSKTPNHTSVFTASTWPTDYVDVFHFDEGSTSATVLDATIAANNASQINTAVATGQIGKAYTFNGSSTQIVTSSVNNNITSSFTLSAWVNSSTFTGHTDQKVVTNETSLSTGGYKLSLYGNTATTMYDEVESRENDGTLSIDRAATGGTILSANTWYYVQGVYDNSTGTLYSYLNGKLDRSSTAANAAGTNGGALIMGSDYAANYWFDGIIDECRVSNVAKSADWIKEEYYNQSSPITYTTCGTTITTNVTNAGALGIPGGAIVYTWTGTGGTGLATLSNWTCSASGNPNQIPPFDGTCSLIIPGGLTNYPVLTANESVYGLTLGAGATINLNGFTLNVGCHIYNNASGASQILYGTSTGTINFNGSLATQYFYGNGTTTTSNVANLTLNNSAGGTLDITGGNVSLYNSLTITQGNILVDNAGSGALTLVSTASGTANVNTIPSLYKITGNVTAQRYIPGGTGYRSYRLLTLPVNINNSTSQISTEAFIDLHSLNGGMLTAGPGTGFSYTTATTNPLMYLYDESRAQNFTAYIAGKNVGIYSMAGSPGYTVTTYGTTTGATKKTAQVPVGTSVQAYFVGPNTALNLTATAPLAATTSATGYINQGTIPVYIYNTNSPTLSYNPATNNTPAKGPGLNQVGNPYPSTIDLDSLYFDNKTGGSAIGPMFWELKEPNNTFVAYSGNHTSSTTGSEAYIASGQGFFVQAISTSSALTFYEKDKVNVTIGTGTSPVLILNQKANSNISASESLPSGLSGLHLQIMEDTATYTQTGIYFNPGWNDKYSPLEDAIDLDGTAPKVYLSSYSSDGARLCINGLGSYSQGKTIKLYASATTSGTYTISLADINNIDGLYNVYLRDHKLNDSVNLRSTNAYTFTINTGDTTTYGANRFDLVVEREALPPYRLLTFTGQKVSSGVQLNWVASGTGNYTGFILEKKGANSTFSPLYTVQSSNNNSDYTFVDTNPVIGNNIYRLAQNDINGNVTYSSLITIGYNNVTSNGYFSVYPNPSKDMINILINSTAATTANYTADIYNTSGVLMDHRVLNTYTWTEDISGYKEGVYIIALKDTSGDVLAKSKFIKVK
ncbi:DUF2341 domain-containing protein [Mucilaginibacter sp. E4BP6]|uniref:DUF2341 domain-containing protein n=1 Tax=Mucilaginibacter sp. E4BP6 TaxID=2723089 RepID=UPI0015C82349|nr:DUF2341 domain-containing protein [Mucilaginibacter sp. E4BP6]NYE67955.1 hypothetical protein [Mucilaginibacter sp. E4BP6]